MISFETERLICKSCLCVEDGKLIENEKENGIDLLNIQPTTGEESGFVFYHKKSPTITVCHIGITFTRKRFEVAYGVDNTSLREQGYMTEALSAFCKWLFENTDQDVIWALPNGEYRDASIKVLENCSFLSADTEYGLIWYELRKGKSWLS